MAASLEWTEWHLTPRGWEHGSWKHDGNSKGRVDPPLDRVLSYRFTDELPAGGAKWKTTNEEIWRSNDDNAIEPLLEKYGDPPQQLYG